VIIFSRIPDLDRKRSRPSPFWPALMEIIRTEKYFAFCSYIFLISLFTASCPIIFSLIEKKVILFENDMIVLLGNLVMIGGLAGYLLAGKAVDRYGTKPIFLICHFSYGMVLFAFIFREVWPIPLIFSLGILHFSYGTLLGATSVANTTEMYKLLPEKNKSLAASINTSLLMGGAGISGVLTSWFLSVGIFSKTWTFLSFSLSDFDVILLGSGIMIILLVVALGLVPSIVVKKGSGIPRL